MSRLVLIRGGDISFQLEEMLGHAFGGLKFEVISTPSEIGILRNCKIVFCCEVDEAGFDVPLFTLLKELGRCGKDSLSGSIGAVFIHSAGGLYTKSLAQRIIFLANTLGCSFIGHPVVEATGDYLNFSAWQKVMKLPLKDICLKQSKKLLQRLLEFKFKSAEKLLVLHASSRKTSNTLMLWNIVEKNLNGIDIRILSVENGRIFDCLGCSFKTCLHYSQQKSCFYGGVVVEEVYPAIEKADSIVWVCPNYNDAVSANLMAVINRLTALYRKISFYDKSIYSIIVSGNSGSDSVACQLIGALNINKGFYLPPYFSLMSIANDPGSILNVVGIEGKASSFAQNIKTNFKGHDTL